MEKYRGRGIWANPYFKYILVPIFVAVTMWVWNKMFNVPKNQNLESYKVESHYQSGGVTAGKINILIDKETLGIKELDGLYQNGKKVGRTKGFNANESSMTFTISEIEFNQPMQNTDVIFSQPYEFQNYAIQIKNVDSLITMMPPEAKGINGIILEKKVTLVA